jgi:hypothetical protein
MLLGKIHNENQVLRERARSFLIPCERQIASKSLARRSGEGGSEISISVEINSYPKGSLEIQSSTKIQRWRSPRLVWNPTVFQHFRKR